MSTPAIVARALLTPPVSERDHVLGPADAGLTLVEYADFECPYSGAAYPILKRIREIMGSDLRFVFRHFPLSRIHPHAESAAEAAEAAGAQGRFWEMHSLLFENQHTLDPWRLVGFAETLRLDAIRSARELQQHTYRSRVREDLIGGINSGVDSSPTFFINGQRYDGPWDLVGLLEGLERARTVAV